MHRAVRQIKSKSYVCLASAPSGEHIHAAAGCPEGANHHAVHHHAAWHRVYAYMMALLDPQQHRYKAIEYTAIEVLTHRR